MTLAVLAYVPQVGLYRLYAGDDCKNFRYSDRNVLTSQATLTFSNSFRRSQYYHRLVNYTTVRRLTCSLIYATHTASLFYDS